MFDDLIPHSGESSRLRRTALTLSSTAFVLLIVAAVAKAFIARIPFSATMLGLGIILLIAAIALLRIDRMKRAQHKEETIEQLLSQVHGEQRRDRLLAFEELRRFGWLQDGSLQGIDLNGLDLQGANLSGADLQGVNLKGANLRGADLHWADLRHADLSGVRMRGANLLWANLEGAQGITDEQLAQVYILRRATLPQGMTYGGRYCLPGDIDDAGRDKIKADDEEGMARWYEVSLEAYREGQQWAEQNRHILQARLE